MTEQSRYGTLSESTAEDNYTAWQLPRDPAVSVRDLVRWAVLAPSTHNTQPWLFTVQGDSITVRPDPSRWLPVSDPDSRQAYVSLGAAIANLLVAARQFGYEAVLDRQCEQEQPRVLITRCTLARGAPSRPDNQRLFEAIGQRCSNRLPHTSQQLPQPLQAFATELSASAGVDLSLVCDQPSKARVGRLLADADRITFANPAFNAELSTWLRPNSSRAFDGMPGFGFGVRDFDSRLLPSLARTGRLAAETAERDFRLLAQETACIGIICTTTDEPAAWLTAGEAFQQFALGATAMGLSVNALAALIETLGFREQLPALFDAPGIPVLFFRVGYPVAAVPHSPRLSAQWVTTIQRNEEAFAVSLERPSKFESHTEEFSSGRLREQLPEVATVIDRYGEDWLSELFTIRNPGLDLASENGQARLAELVEGRNQESDGSWIYFRGTGP